MLFRYPDFSPEWPEWLEVRASPVVHRELTGRFTRIDTITTRPFRKGRSFFRSPL